MRTYWIPAAQLLSAAITAVCFLIAFIVLNARTPGRHRTLGVLGVAMVLVSAMLHAANVSVAGAYGRDTVVYAAGSIVVGVTAAAGLVVLALAAIRARTPARAGDH